MCSQKSGHLNEFMASISLERELNYNVTSLAADCHKFPPGDASLLDGSRPGALGGSLSIIDVHTR